MQNQSGVIEVTVTFSLGLGLMAPPLCVWKVQVITLNMFWVNKNNADTWAPKAVNFTLNNIFSYHPPLLLFRSFYYCSSKDFKILVTFFLTSQRVAIVCLSVCVHMRAPTSNLITLSSNTVVWHQASNLPSSSDTTCGHGGSQGALSHSLLHVFWIFTELLSAWPKYLRGKPMETSLYGARFVYFSLEFCQFSLYIFWSYFNIIPNMFLFCLILI